jgi:hypothetical protein
VVVDCGCDVVLPLFVTLLFKLLLLLLFCTAAGLGSWSLTLPLVDNDTFAVAVLVTGGMLVEAAAAAAAALDDCYLVWFKY